MCLKKLLGLCLACAALELCWPILYVITWEETVRLRWRQIVGNGCSLIRPWHKATAFMLVCVYTKLGVRVSEVWDDSWVGELANSTITAVLTIFSSQHLNRQTLLMAALDSVDCSKTALLVTAVAMLSHFLLFHYQKWHLSHFCYMPTASWGSKMKMDNYYKFYCYTRHLLYYSHHHFLTRLFLKLTFSSYWL